MIFKDAWLLLFLPFVIVIWYLLRKRDLSSSVTFSHTPLIENYRPTLKILLAKNLICLRIIAILLFLLSLARPRVPLEAAKVEKEGIDIVLTIDVSGSMLAEDFKLGRIRQNRLAVVKNVVRDFILKRNDDRIAMVAFAARAYTVCPLTLDYSWLVKNLDRVDIGVIEDGTAIGSAISSSLNRLKDSEAKSKVVVLLTDGVNNTGKVSPLVAAEAARALGIKVYTIGAGTKGLAPYPVKGFWGQTVYQNVKIEVDEDTLKKIAELTGARYFRATDMESLRDIYREIDTLERSPIEDQGFRQYREIFPLFLIPGLGIFLLELVLSNTVLRKLP